MRTTATEMTVAVVVDTAIMAAMGATTVATIITETTATVTAVGIATTTLTETTTAVTTILRSAVSPDPGQAPPRGKTTTASVRSRVRDRARR